MKCGAAFDEREYRFKTGSTWDGLAMGRLLIRVIYSHGFRSNVSNIFTCAHFHHFHLLLIARHARHFVHAKTYGTVII